MWRKKILPYFHYSKKERTGILVLSGLILLLWIIPFFFSPGTDFTKEPELTLITHAMKELEEKQRDSFSLNREAYYKNPIGNNDEKNSSLPGLFPFDPNIATETEWAKLGLPPKTISVIRHYIEKGGRFRKPDDLQRVYGLKNSDYNRLVPFIRINTMKSEGRHLKESERSTGFSKPDSSLYRKATKKAIDINIADQAEWESLPGIGEKLAARILLFRNKLGGFHSVTQVAETYGISPELFLEIRPLLNAGEKLPVKQININAAGYQELKQHPYIGTQLAKILIAYRDQHGAFAGTEALLNIGVITPAILEKISPYLKTE